MTEIQNKDLDLEGLYSNVWILAFNAEKLQRTSLLHLILQKTRIIFIFGAEEVYATI
jgi:hypothetical protein